MLLPPLTNGIIHKRYKRFLADVELDSGEQVVAHCPNTGAMTGCWEPGARVQLSYADNPKRKLQWTLERVDMGAGWIGVHTGRANPVIAEAIETGLIPTLTGYQGLKREVTYTPPGHPKSRLDIFLTQGGTQAEAFVEIKNTTLLDNEIIRFPDAVTERGLKHLDVLLAAVHSGYRGVIVFAVNRPEGKHFAPANAIDKRYAQRLKDVVAQGVEIVAPRILHTPTGMEVVGLVPIELDA
ncbi:MAG: DNA/RNA nuclease SfsA [Gammaproteobacteria bacterium]|nr:DNA/RNA nuclease SfsA [Gammaproteobacteria bacterium]